MSRLFTKALELLVGNTNTDVTQFSVSSLKVPKTFRPLKKLTERELIQLESEIGGKLFGPIPTGHRREFFNLDKNTWIWYEEYNDTKGKNHSVTTRYEVQEGGILKAQDGAKYTYLEGEELQNFGVVVQIYYEQVMRGVYKRDPKTGHKFSA